VSTTTSPSCAPTSRIKRSSAIGAVAAGAAALAFPAVVRAQGAPIRVGALASDTFGMAYYAQDMGFFSKAGLNVQLLPFNNGSAQAEAAAGGSLDIGVGEATELANGVLRGLPFTIIAGGSLYNTNAPTTLLVVAKNSPIKTAKDLEGKTIAVPALVALTSTAVRAWLVQNGADLSKVRFVELPLSQQAEAIARGTVDAAHLGEPQLTAGAALVQPIAKPYDAIAKQFLISDWFTTKEWLAKNPETAKRFVSAVYETQRWANTHHDESLLILAKYAKYDPQKVRGMRRSMYATSCDPRLIQPVLDAGAKYKALAKPFNAADLIAKLS
jgi:NitT/TauT family transport system substrate-binding protein